MSLNEKQKKSQKKYYTEKKPIYFTVSFKNDQQFGIEIKEYLKENGLNVSSYIKDLIKKDFTEKNIPFTKIEKGKPGRPKKDKTD